MSTRKEYDVSRIGFIVDPNSIVKSFGLSINWDEVTDTDADGNKQILGGTFVADKGGGAVPRTDAEVALSDATESGGTATYTSTNEHGYSAGDIITIEGFAQGDYNVEDVEVASVVDANNFTVDGIQNAPTDDGGGGTSYSKAVGILYEGINKAERERNQAGQAVLIGGVIYENLLPDDGETDFDQWKTEADAHGNGFTFQTYSDNRTS